MKDFRTPEGAYRHPIMWGFSIGAVSEQGTGPGSIALFTFTLARADIKLARVVVRYRYSPMMTPESDWKKSRAMVPVLREKYLAEKTARIAVLLTDPKKSETEQF